MCMVFFIAGTAGAAEIQVGVAWQAKSGMAERVLEGVRQALSELAPQIVLDVRRDLPKMEDLDAVVTEFENTKKAMVIMRSNGAQLLGKRNLKIPSFIGAANNPVELGIAETLSKPRHNMSGVTYYIPARVKLENLLFVYPDLKNILLLVEKGHPSAPVDATETEAAGAEFGMKVSIAFCTSLAEAVEAVRSAGEDVSVLLGSQALLIDNAAALVEPAGKRLLFSYSERPVEDGALAGIVADDAKLGRMLGKLLAEVLVDGKSIDGMPFLTDPEPKLFLNGPAVERLGLEIPFDILNMAVIVE